MLTENSRKCVNKNTIMCMCICVYKYMLFMGAEVYKLDEFLTRNHCDLSLFVPNSSPLLFQANLNVQGLNFATEESFWNRIYQLYIISLSYTTCSSFRQTLESGESIKALHTQTEIEYREFIIIIIDPTITLLPRNRSTGRNPHPCGISRVQKGKRVYN